MPPEGAEEATRNSLAADALNKPLDGSSRAFGRAGDKESLNPWAML